jgi:arsenite-transporting ATPase
MKLPFIAKDDVDLNRVSNELVVRIGGFKRHILLPRQVAASRSVNAKMEDDQLCITFKGVDHE